LVRNVLTRVALAALLATAISTAGLGAAQTGATETRAVDRPELAEVQRLFYSGKYDAAATLALSLRSAHPDDLDSYEIRASALHFQLKRALRDGAGTEIPFKQCTACPELLKQFLDETAQGQTVSRARLQKNPTDDTAQFFLGKFDLNYVWLHLGTLGRRTGWNEYWEARKSLDAVLKRNPKHVRARTARAWMDYIVDTKMSRGTRWILGGGSKKRALTAVREAANTPSDFFVHTEAQFALWDMLVRERNFPDAAVVARELIKDFPDNHELIAFLKANG
jgi:hypothetical protein